MGGGCAVFIDKSQFDLNAPPEQDGPEQTGWRRFLQIMQVEFLNLVKLNLLFLVSCLLIVTIPPALYAAHTLVRKMVLGEPVSCWRDYWAAFKAGWKRGWPAFLLTALPMGLSGFGAEFYLRYTQQSLLAILPFAFCLCVFLAAALSSTYLYGLLYAGKPLKDALRTALILGIGRPLRAVLAALCWYGLTLLTILFLPLSGAYLVLLGFTLPFLLGAFYTRTVLAKFCGESSGPAPS